MSSLCRLYVVYMSSRSLKLTRTARLKLSHHMLANCWYISPSIVVMIPACHSGGRSSSPCWESNLCWKYWVTLQIVTRMAERSKALLLSRMLRKWPGFDSRMIQLNFWVFFLKMGPRSQKIQILKNYFQNRICLQKLNTKHERRELLSDPRFEPRTLKLRVTCSIHWARRTD